MSLLHDRSGASVPTVPLCTLCLEWSKGLRGGRAGPPLTLEPGVARGRDSASKAAASGLHVERSPNLLLAFWELHNNHRSGLLSQNAATLDLVCTAEVQEQPHYQIPL